jgi:hypothetical protein
MTGKIKPVNYKLFERAFPFCCKMRFCFAATYNFILQQNGSSILQQNEVAFCCKVNLCFAAK